VGLCSGKSFKNSAQKFSEQKNTFLMIFA